VGRERVDMGWLRSRDGQQDQGGNNWDEVSGSRGQKRWRNGTVTSFIPLRGGARIVRGGRDGMGRPAGGSAAWFACKALGNGEH